MFGKRIEGNAALAAPQPAAAPAAPAEMKPVKKASSSSEITMPSNKPTSSPGGLKEEASEAYYQTKATIFNALFETIDVSALAGMQPEKARDVIRTIVDEIIAIRNVLLSVAEQNQIIIGI